MKPSEWLAMNLDQLLGWLFSAAALALLLALACAGCASFSTVQSDASTETNGTRRIITTEARARTMLAGKQALASWRANQTDKSQGATVGGLSQEANGAEFLKALAEVIKAGQPAAATAAALRAPAPAATTTSTNK